MQALIVDDSEPMRKLLALMLRRFGFATLEASSALDALGQIERHGAVAVALVDWGLPGVDGLELIRNIRKLRRFQDVKLVMTTARDEREYRAQAEAAGADEYLMKPLTPSAVRQKLEALGLMRDPLRGSAQAAPRGA